LEKYVKTAGQEFFDYGVLGRSVRAFKSIKLLALVVLVFVSLVLLIPIMVMLFLANLHILSRPSLIELLSTGTEFRSGFLSVLSIEEAVDEGLKKFVDKQEELLGVPRMLREWKAKVLVFV
jgi:hypothetical protein